MLHFDTVSSNSACFLCRHNLSTSVPAYFLRFGRLLHGFRFLHREIYMSSRLLNDKYLVRHSNLFSLALLAQEDWSQRGFRRKYWVTRAPQCNHSFTGLSTSSTSTRFTG